MPDRGRAGPGGETRDYARLAGIAGYGPKQYEALDGRSRRAAQLEIDNELALRKEVSATAKHIAAGGEAPLRGREKWKADRAYDRTVEQNMRAGGHELPSPVRTEETLWERCPSA